MAVVALAILTPLRVCAQIDAEQVIAIGRNVLSMDDYMLSIQYFNQAIKAKPYLSDPYYYRAIAKLSLEDYKGAEEDCTLAIERNKFKVETYRARGFARQALGKDSLAIEDYDTGLNYNPNDKYFLYYKSVAQTDMKDYAGADSTFSTLMRLYPRFEDAYTARGRMNLLRGDTVAAEADVTKAISLQPNLMQPYLLRADIEARQKNWEAALADMDAAIRLQPREADLYVNRAFVRYNLDDYFGAMADYNYTLELQPFNTSALFNRGLLRYEVKSLDKAAADFEQVLKLAPDNFHARYNLGLVNLERGRYRDALKDFEAIARKYPRFYPAYYARGEALRGMGNMKAAMQSVYYADNLVKQYVKNPEKNPLDRPTIQMGTANDASHSQDDESESEVMDRFNQLVTVDASAQSSLSYNDRIKGRVQDRDVAVSLEPAYMISFAQAPESLQSTSNYFRDLDDFNSKNYLTRKLNLLPENIETPPSQYEALWQMVEEYSEAAAGSNPRPADLLALGVAKTMAKDYEAAIKALDQAIEKLPNFAIAFMERAYARQHGADKMGLQLAMNDYDQALRLNPNLVYAWFNKGNLYYAAGDYTSALDCYTHALDIYPQFGQALFNRGLTYLNMGNKRQAFADLSKAGELGVLPSYNLLKRMK